MEFDHIFSQGSIFERALNHCIETIEASLEHYELELSERMEYSAQKWKNVALRLLSADLEIVRECLGNLQQPGKLKSLLEVAANERSLAKNLDAFRFDFAGSDYERKLNTEVDVVVRAASDVIRAIAHQA